MKKNLYLYILLLVSLLCACGQASVGQYSSSTTTTWQVQYDLGLRYLSEGNYKEAIIAFTAAIEIDPKQAPAYVGRGDAYIGLGETEENLTAAQADYEKAIGLDETLAEAYMGLADVYIRRRDYDKALEILQQGLEKLGENQVISDKIAEINDGNISDSSGNARRTTGYDGSGAVQWWHDYTYNADGTRTSVTAFDASGGQISYVELSYNESGQELMSYGFMDTTGEVFPIENIYDANGTLTARVCYYLDGTSDTETYTYNGAGQLICADIVYSGGSFLYELYEYDSWGNQTKRSNYCKDGSLNFYEVYYYDESGTQIRCDSYNYRGELIGYRTERYNEQGDWIGTDTYDAAGNLTQSWLEN